MRPTLTIKLSLIGEELSREYLVPDATLIGARSPLPAGLRELAGMLDRGSEEELVRRLTGGSLARIGQDLFDALFGPWEERAWAQALAGVVRDRSFKAPIAEAFRVRILTADPLLSGLPWRMTTWEGRRLTLNGWSFEVTLVEAPLSRVHLPARCNVLVIAPAVAETLNLGTERHVAALREALGRVSDSYKTDDGMAVARTRAEVQRALAKAPPQIVYYYGHAGVSGSGTSLEIEAEKGKNTLLSIADFKRMLPEPHPLIVVLGGCMSVASGCHLAGHQLSPEVPVVVAHRNTAWADHAGASTIAWLVACLGGDRERPHALSGAAGDRDPMVLLDRLPGAESTRGLPWTTAVSYTSYAAWTAGEPERAAKKPTIGLRLDRDVQRNTAQGQIAKLASSDERRVEAIVAFGAPGNHVERASEQMRDHIERCRPPIARLRHLPARFPEIRSQLVRGVHDELRAELGIQPHDALGKALKKRAPSQDSSRIRPVLWIDWGTFGPGAQAQLKPNELSEWLEFCAAHLATECPPELRIVAFLSMEVDERHHARLEADFDGLRGGHLSNIFDCCLLPALPNVKRSDLLAYLRDPSNTRCPAGLVQEATALVYEETGGAYERVVALLDEAEATSFTMVVGRLKQKRQKGDRGEESY